MNQLLNLDEKLYLSVLKVNPVLAAEFCAAEFMLIIRLHGSGNFESDAICLMCFSAQGHAVCDEHPSLDVSYGMVGHVTTVAGTGLGFSKMCTEISNGSSLNQVFGYAVTPCLNAQVVSDI